ncbi:DoxX family protein [Roseicyclus marinus]|uniref:DoxX family protein n=1 Tax=Roseicyclus marinus TaxID=2161673 RepID=UPI00240F3723|nr:DoxX family protein [Roseicyclus marinus]MDG3042919.1 DoxX family protein [Roseicyclus marinus]
MLRTGFVAGGARAALDLAGRGLLALLFIGGAVQKTLDPAPVMAMLDGLGLPGALIWPLAGFNALGAVALFLPGLTCRAALVLALYCMATSAVHWQLRADPWQVTIMVKNWAVAGGLLILAARPAPDPRRA